LLLENKKPTARLPRALAAPPSAKPCKSATARPPPPTCCAWLWRGATARPPPSLGPVGGLPPPDPPCWGAAAPGTFEKINSEYSIVQSIFLGVLKWSILCVFALLPVKIFRNMDPPCTHHNTTHTKNTKTDTRNPHHFDYHFPPL
jgi:hypothetical protein